MKKVFGLSHISKKVNELLLKDVKHKHEPEKWTWKPHNPDKIRNLKEIIAEEKKSVNYSCITNYSPDTSAQKVILIFAIGNLSFGFINHLENKKIKYVFLNYSQFILKGEINISLANDFQHKYLTIENISINLNDISVVIWNGPTEFLPLFDFEMIPKKKDRNEFLFKKRWLQFLKELPLLLNEDVAWLPGKPLNGSQEWQNKLGEYNLALNLGLNIPPIIYSNSLSEFSHFTAKYGNDLLIREFSTPPYSFPPISVRADKLSLKYFQNAPSCFQKYINKKYELRVIILFDEVYPCKIDSQNSELAKRDWRVYDDENVKWELIELPQDLNTKLVAFCKSLNLTWCSIDMIYGDDELYYFLELNRPGAHYWLEPFIGLDITDKIINSLLKRKYLEAYK